MGVNQLAAPFPSKEERDGCHRSKIIPVGIAGLCDKEEHYCVARDGRREDLHCCSSH